jgi:hypothetical protein
LSKLCHFLQKSGFFERAKTVHFKEGLIAMEGLIAAIPRNISFSGNPLLQRRTFIENVR